MPHLYMYEVNKQISFYILLIRVLYVCQICALIFLLYLSLRKHAYSNIKKILPQKNENFQIKILIFSYSAQIRK